MLDSDVFSVEYKKNVLWLFLLLYRYYRDSDVTCTNIDTYFSSLPVLKGLNT